MDMHIKYTWQCAVWKKQIFLYIETDYDVVILFFQIGRSGANILLKYRSLQSIEV